MAPTHLRAAVALLAATALSPAFLGCARGAPLDDEPAGDSSGCLTLSGEPWRPSAQPAPHDSRTRVDEKVFELDAPLAGPAQAGIAGRSVTVDVPLDAPLGDEGSLTLTAEVLGTTLGAVPGLIHPYLVSFVNGGTDAIAIDRSRCAEVGYFRCAEPGKCRLRPECAPAPGGAYADAEHWLSRQRNGYSNLSVNLLPAPGGSRRLVSGPGARARARYLVFVEGRADVPASARARLRVRAVRKRADSPRARAVEPQGSRAIDVNLVLVGAANVAGARTETGKRNLDEVLARVSAIYAQADVAFGRVSVVEWGCELGGDAYATLDSADAPRLFDAAAPLLPRGDGPALNVYVVSTIALGGAKGATLGISTGVPGPPGRGGVIFATFDHLDREQDLGELSTTVAHEIGHYLGLDHVSEASKQRRDWLSDTPACVESELRDSAGEPGRRVEMLTVRSCSRDRAIFPPTGQACATVCRGYDGRHVTCPTRPECEFNHLMWWTTKNAGDGNLLSAQSAAAIRLSPLVR